MERSNKFAARRTSRFPGSPAARQGKFTLVTLIAILGMMVIIGFVGNAGYVVTEKMNTQNAADADRLLQRPVDGPRHERRHGHEPFARRSDRAWSW